MSKVEQQIIVKIDGVAYHGVPAKVERTTLGYEDHGIPTAWLHCAGPGWGQGAGGFALGGAATHAFVFGVMDALGCRSWEQLTGINCVLLYEDDRQGTVVGIKRTMGDEHILLRPAMIAAERKDKGTDIAVMDAAVAMLPQLDELSVHEYDQGGLLGNSKMQRVDALRLAVRDAQG